MYDPSMSMDASTSEFASQRNQFIQGCTGFAAGATVAVIIRLLARWKNSTKLAGDDLSIALSLIPLWALAANGVVLASQGGLGQDRDTLTPAQMDVFYPAAFASYILYGLAITAAKLSILLLYRRIFTSRPFRHALYFFMAVCVIWCILVVFFAIFRCSPVSAAWSPDDYAGTCIELRRLYYGTSSSNILLDVIINLLPARQIWALQLPTKQRILLILCMCLGVLSIAAGIGRILTVPSLLADNLPATIAMPYLFVIIEPAFAIMCACLPTYRPLALWFAASIKNSRAGYRIKSFISTSSVANSSSDRRSRGSSFWTRWWSSSSASEKEALSSTQTTPDLRKDVEGNGRDGQWSKPHMDTHMVAIVGQD